MLISTLSPDNKKVAILCTKNNKAFTKEIRIGLNTLGFNYIGNNDSFMACCSPTEETLAKALLVLHRGRNRNGLITAVIPEEQMDLIEVDCNKVPEDMDVLYIDDTPYGIRFVPITREQIKIGWSSYFLPA